MGTQAALVENHPGAAVPELPELVERAEEFARASRAEATLAAYASDLAHWQRWADTHGVATFPATPEAVVLYVSDLASTAKPSTITRRLAALSVAHQALGFDSPTRDPRVQSVMRGIRRTLGVAPRQAAPATIGEVRRMVARLGDTPIDRRDRALLLLGFAGAFRRSELVSLDVADLTDTTDGLIIRVRRSKTDPDGRGDTKAIPYGGDSESCPVRAVTTWLTDAGIDHGPVFRSVDRHGNVGDSRLTGRSVSLIVKRLAGRADLDPDRYSGHSLRAGFVTTAAAAGASERAIARQTGHAAGSTVLRSYVRHATPFADNAVSVLGL